MGYFDHSIGEPSRLAGQPFRPAGSPYGVVTRAEAEGNRDPPPSAAGRCQR